MGPDAGAPRRAARDRARSADPAAGAPAGRASPASARGSRPSPIMPPRSRRSARPRSSSARRSRPAPTWSARTPRANLLAAAGRRCRRRRSRRSSAAIEAALGAPLEALFASSTKCRSAPPRSRRSTAPSPPRAATVAVKVLRPGIEEEFARAIETYEWAAAHVEALRRRGRAAAPAAGRRPFPAMDRARARPAARGRLGLRAAREYGRRARLLRPRDRLAAHRAPGADARMARRHQAQRPRRADRRRPRSARRSPRSWSAPSCARRWSTASSTPTSTRAICSRCPTAGSPRSISASWAGSTAARGCGWPKSSTA